jgi:hypothetical protein
MGPGLFLERREDFPLLLVRSQRSHHDVVDCDAAAGSRRRNHLTGEDSYLRGTVTGNYDDALSLFHEIILSSPDASGETVQPLPDPLNPGFCPGLRISLPDALKPSW